MLRFRKMLFRMDLHAGLALRQAHEMMEMATDTETGTRQTDVRLSTAYLRPSYNMHKAACHQ